MTTHPSLFDRIGGPPAVAAAAELFYRKVLSDPVLAGYFDDVDMDRQAAKQAAFLTMAIASGMTSAITNPLHGDVVKACMGADVMMGHDPDCARWIRRFREQPPQLAGAAVEGAPRGRREGGHRRRV